MQFGMHFIRAKLVVIFILTINATIPMENQFWQNGTQLGVCGLSGNATIPMETQFLYNATQPEHGVNYASRLAFQVVSLGLLTVQVASLVLLKKKNALFGKEVIPENVTIRGVSIPLAALTDPLSDSAWGPWIFIASHPNVCLPLTFNSACKILALVGSMIHISNSVYNDALKVAKQVLPKTQHLLSIKNKVDIAGLDGAKCLICYEDELRAEYVNICNQEDHIFCTRCLTYTFNQQKDKLSFKDSISFFCHFCAKEVPFNDEKFEIKPKITTWKSCFLPILLQYGIGFFVLTQILLCPFS